MEYSLDTLEATVLIVIEMGKSTMVANKEIQVRCSSELQDGYLAMVNHWLFLVEV